MDDVLENLSFAWVDFLNARYGTRVKREDLTGWDMPQFFPELTPEQVYGVLREDALWKTVVPLPGAVEGVRELIRRGHEVYVVTSSYYKTVRSKIDLVLKKYFPFIDDAHLIITANKQMIIGDILIDDGPHNLLGGVYDPIIMDAPYNRSFPAEENLIPRVRDWDEIMDIIHGYETRYEDEDKIVAAIRDYETKHEEVK